MCGSLEVQIRSLCTPRISVRVPSDKCGLHYQAGPGGGGKIGVPDGSSNWQPVTLLSVLFQLLLEVSIVMMMTIIISLRDAPLCTRRRNQVLTLKRRSTALITSDYEKYPKY